jgi:late competence protein required for DNA uptake (superfamily II DNA/RNA helicase)
VNIKQFFDKYEGYNSHAKIAIKCDGPCGLVQCVTKTRAQQNIYKNGCYYCRSCGQAAKHARKPMTDITKGRIARALEGVDKSDEARQAMSRAAAQRWARRKKGK